MVQVFQVNCMVAHSTLKMKNCGSKKLCQSLLKNQHQVWSFDLNWLSLTSEPPKTIWNIVDTLIFLLLSKQEQLFQNLHCFKWFLVYCEAAAASIFAGINHCFQEILWQGMLLFIYFPKKLMRTHAMSIDQSKRFFEFSSMTFLYQDGVGLFQLLLYA